MVVWYASGITGGSAGTMEEENLKSGWRRLGGAFSIPPDKRTIVFAEAALAKPGSRPAPKRIRS
jgi:hypothetical protein